MKFSTFLGEARFVIYIAILASIVVAGVAIQIDNDMEPIRYLKDVCGVFALFGVFGLVLSLYRGERTSDEIWHEVGVISILGLAFAAALYPAPWIVHVPATFAIAYFLSNYLASKCSQAGRHVHLFWALFASLGGMFAALAMFRLDPAALGSFILAPMGIGAALYGLWPKAPKSVQPNGPRTSVEDIMAGRFPAQVSIKVGIDPMLESAPLPPRGKLV